MKNVLSALAILMTFIYLPFLWYMSFLLYKHVHATELMWFMFWVNIPFALLSQIIGHLLKEVSK